MSKETVLSASASSPTMSSEEEEVLRARVRREKAEADKAEADARKADAEANQAENSTTSRFWCGVEKGAIVVAGLASAALVIAELISLIGGKRD